MRLVIHAGAHKTATTSIQHWLKQSRLALASSGVLYLEPDVLNKAGIINRLHNAEKGQHARVGSQFLRLLSEKSAMFRMKTLLLSHESILSFSNMLPGAADKSFYGSLENSARCIQALSEEYDLRLVFYIRRQDTFLSSVYLEYIKRGNYYMEFEEYCRSIDYRNISWLGLLGRFSEVTKNLEIVVRPFELLGKGGGVFMREFLDAANIPANKRLLGSSFPRSNEGVSNKALKLIQACGPHLEAAERRAMGSFFRTRFPVSNCGKASVLSPELSTEIVAYFADENRRVFDEWMPDYADLSY